MLDILTETQQFWYITMHNLFLIMGAVFLWGTFIFLALIARRYEIVFHKPTKWQYMLIAPSGILLYVLLSAVAYGQEKLMMPNLQRWIGYSAFLLSGIFSMGGTLQFMHIIRPRSTPETRRR
ncbi:MAG: hypothetical protein B6244_09055 [Candidatus Cloacimonetes bacterium 4572_55]|nr:MAG: hypothetical protein B6244_09055 [Candidatus Cloacimonetes bacterium 4572_55]